MFDELALSLIRTVRQEYIAAAEASGTAYVGHPGEAVVDRMIEEYGRRRRAAGAGFYDYVDGRRTGLWPGLFEHFGSSADRAVLR